jgi:hypothetical protein
MAQRWPDKEDAAWSGPSPLDRRREQSRVFEISSSRAKTSGADFGVSQRTSPSLCPLLDKLGVGWAAASNLTDSRARGHPRPGPPQANAAAELGCRESLSKATSPSTKPRRPEPTKGVPTRRRSPNTPPTTHGAATRTRAEIPRTTANPRPPTAPTSPHSSLRSVLHPMYPAADNVVLCPDTSLTRVSAGQLVVRPRFPVPCYSTLP